ncbi:MAG: thiol peroxidase, partial [Planctomycetota bacterium]
LDEISLSDCSGKTVILNIFPSVDTSTCAQSVRTFNQRATERPDAVVLNVSMDLPFALKRFCAAEGIERAEAASVFRSGFPTAYGVALTDGPLQGLCARAVVVVGPDGLVRHTQLVAEIADEPDYDAALQAAAG